jgi:hypothetical protein
VPWWQIAPIHIADRSDEYRNRNPLGALAA